MAGKKLTLYLCAIGIFLPVFSVFAGTIVSPHKYAWSNNVGYINFENVIVNDTSLSGYAWSANAGWINFAPTQGGVANDGAGNLSGSAWGANLGWIDFDNVSIGPSTGTFSGTATGALAGTINFDCDFCDVQTDWREVVAPVTPLPAPVVSSATSVGGGGLISFLKSLFFNVNNAVNNNPVNPPLVQTLTPIFSSTSANPVPAESASPSQTPNPQVANNTGAVGLLNANPEPVALFDVTALPIQVTSEKPSITGLVFFFTLFGLIIGVLFIIGKQYVDKLAINKFAREFSDSKKSDIIDG